MQIEITEQHSERKRIALFPHISVVRCAAERVAKARGRTRERRFKKSVLRQTFGRPRACNAAKFDDFQFRNIGTKGAGGQRAAAPVHAEDGKWIAVVCAREGVNRILLKGSHPALVFLRKRARKRRAARGR
jgi:predicted RNase H-like nuclease